MWELVGRTLFVFALWGAAFAAAFAWGVPARPAEFAAAIGAGATLAIWGLLEARLQRRARPITAPEPVEAEQRRASV